METKGGYDMNKKGYSHNMSDYSPNAGENHMTYSSGGAESVGDSAGVVDGLSTLEAAPVKNAEMVTMNQRPEGRRESAGDGFVMGC